MGKRIMYIQGKLAGIKEDPNKAGIIEVRPGTAGIDLGDKRHMMAYIRVLDENHCFKGMCLYSDNLPDGYDIIYYYRDPHQGLKALRTVTPEMELGKEIMTRIKIDDGWLNKEEYVQLAAPFLKEEESVINKCLECMKDAPWHWCCRMECGEHELCRGCEAEARKQPKRDCK